MKIKDSFNMPYFYKDDNSEIVYRQHKYNSEALDGLIHEMPSEDKAALLLHSPNRSFGWDVSIVKETDVEDGYNLLQQLGSTKEKGKPYYKLVKLDDIDKYVSDNDNLKLLEKKKKQINKNSSKITYVETNQEVPEVSGRESKEETEKTNNEKYQVSLMRDEEQPIKILR